MVVNKILGVTFKFGLTPPPFPLKPAHTNSCLCHCYAAENHERGAVLMHSAL